MVQEPLHGLGTARRPEWQKWGDRKGGMGGGEAERDTGPILQSLVSCDVVVLHVPKFFDSHPIKRWGSNSPPLEYGLDVGK